MQRYEKVARSYSSATKISSFHSTHFRIDNYMYNTIAILTLYGHCSLLAQH